MAIRHLLLNPAIPVSTCLFCRYKQISEYVESRLILRLMAVVSQVHENTASDWLLVAVTGGLFIWCKRLTILYGVSNMLCRHIWNKVSLTCTGV